MKRVFSLLLTFALVSPIYGQDEKGYKIGTINMGRLLSSYHKVKDMQTSFGEHQKEVSIASQERIEFIRAQNAEAKKIQTDAQAPSLSDEERRELFQKAAQQQEQIVKMRDDFVDKMARNRSAMHEEAKMKMEVLQKEVLQIIQEVAEEEGYDYVFDSSGVSNKSMRVLMFTKDAADITGLLLDRINQDAQSEGPEEPKGE